ncbi:TIGR02206 family membrane protein [Nocardioides sp. GY 10113]|uniref:YwaF family protein n=1 Tax=Nocardioides sp. GY 10113 TaxID=2569761 RepID=UPI0010A88240|nr:TIGR02206 family membrane protein [Nocardioides sp. GY 10113]TIC87784.1 TIGR02206 family membrane protein [Nocardioides sp. GY 10113]
MTPYGATHLVPLALFGVGLVGAVALGRRRRGLGRPTALDRAWAIAVAAATVPFQVVDVLTRFELGVSLPLHLCDLAWVAAAVALWTHHRVAVALTFYWSLLTLQAIVTPSLGEEFPELRYLAFWALHLLIVWAAGYLTIGLGLTPGWREYRATMALTLAWVAVAGAFNAVAGTNYGYLCRKPGAGSALDLLGPWPAYVVAEVAIVAAVWAAMTALASRRPKVPADST